MEPKMPSPRPSGRLWRLGLACSVATSALMPLAMSPAAAAEPPAEEYSAAAPGASFTLRSRDLTVTADAGFPQVVTYADRNSGATLRGNDATIAQVTINGKAEPVEVASRGD